MDDIFARRITASLESIAKCLENNNYINYHDLEKEHEESLKSKIL